MANECHNSTIFCLEMGLDVSGVFQRFPKYKRQGVGSDLVQKMVHQIKSEYDDVYVAMQSRNPAIHKWCDNRNWQNIPYDQVCDQVYNDPEVEKDKVMDWSSRDGWQFRMADVHDALNIQ